MFVFSQQHPWQGEEAVQQVLVFGSQAAAAEFVKLFAIRLEQQGVKEASDSGLGAVYKIRAVKNSDGEWNACVRDGCTGVMLFELPWAYTESENAIMSAKLVLHSMVSDSFK